MKATLAADWRLLVYGFLMMFCSGPGQTYLISLYGGQIRSAFALSHSEFGAIYSTATLTSAVAIVWSGRLIDHLDLTRLSLAIVAILAVGCWWTGYSNDVITLTIGIFVLRHAGQGLMTHAGGTVMVRYFDRIKGKTTAFAWLGFAAAEAVLPSVTIAMISYAGWRGAIHITGVAVLLLMVPAILILLRGHRDRHRRYLERLEVGADSTCGTRSRRHWTRAEVLRDPNFYLVIPALMAPALLFTGFFFHQIHLVETKGWSLTWWGHMFALYAGVALLSTLVAGPVIDRVGAKRLLPYFGLPFALGFLCLWGSSDQLAGFSFLMLTGVTTGWVATLGGPLWSEAYGSKNLGAIKSVASALTVFASALSPFILGWLIDHGASMEILALYASIYIVAASIVATFAFRHAQI